MPKTAEEVIAKLQRAREHTRRHLLGLIERNERMHHEVKTMEDTLAWVHRKLKPFAHEPVDGELVVEAEVTKVVDVIEKRIPRRLGLLPERPSE